jgi:hypothetical protein
VVAAIVSTDAAREHRRQAVPARGCEQRYGPRDRFGDVAAAEQRRIGKTFDEIDDAERRPPSDADTPPKPCVR